MTVSRIFSRVIVVIAVLAALTLAFRWMKPGSSTESASVDVWTCSMHPQIRLPKPRACPICGMNLIRVSDLSSEQSQVIERAGIQTEPVEERELFKEIRTVGKLDYNERRVAFISARVAGRVDRIFADFTGMVVKKGDHLVDIYSPDLYSGQRELLIALDSQSKGKQQESQPDPTGGASLLESARAKLLLWGLLPEQIKEIETTHKMRTHVTIYAPLGGIVVEKMVREGQYVKDGDPLYRIADLDPIWLYLNIYEFDLAWVRFGQQVDVRVEAYPGEVFKGTVTFIDPFLDDATRTVKVRVNLKNPDRRLKPQMYAAASILVKLLADGRPEGTGLEGKYACPMHPEVIRDSPGKCPVCEMPLEQIPPIPIVAKSTMDEHAHHDHHEHEHAAESKVDPKTVRLKEPPASTKGVLAVPVSSILDTGRRQIAYRRNSAGVFELVELKLGARSQTQATDGKVREYYPVLAGLKRGDKVVVQGGFLLDSQRQIEGMPSLLFPQGVSGGATGHSGHAAPITKQKTAPGVGHQH